MTSRFPEEWPDDTVEKSHGNLMNILALVKESERYVFLYDDTLESAEAILKVLNQYAEDEELSFTSFDAEILGQKARKMREDAKSDEEFGEELE